MRVMMAPFGLVFSCLELVPFLALTVTKSSGFVLHLLPELVDFVVKALPGLVGSRRLTHRLIPMSPGRHLPLLQAVTPSRQEPPELGWRPARRAIRSECRSKWQS